MLGPLGTLSQPWVPLWKLRPACLRQGWGKRDDVPATVRGQVAEGSASGGGGLTLPCSPFPVRPRWPSMPSCTCLHEGPCEPGDRSLGGPHTLTCAKPRPCSEPSRVDLSPIPVWSHQQPVSDFPPLHPRVSLRHPTSQGQTALPFPLSVTMHRVPPPSHRGPPGSRLLFQVEETERWGGREAQVEMGPLPPAPVSRLRRESSRKHELSCHSTERGGDRGGHDP